MQQLSKMLLYAIVISATALQAGVKVTGTVTSESGEALSYANVTVVGTNVGTASGEDGTYSQLANLVAHHRDGRHCIYTAG